MTCIYKRIMVEISYRHLHEVDSDCKSNNKNTMSCLLKTFAYNFICIELLVALDRSMSRRDSLKLAFTVLEVII